MPILHFESIFEFTTLTVHYSVKYANFWKIKAPTDIKKINIFEGSNICPFIL